MSDYADLVKRLREHVEIYDENTFMREADMHSDGCICSRCRRDWVNAAAGAIGTLVRERDEANARSESRGKILLRTRNKLINIKDAVESDDDRAFFGSTNDADEFFTVVEALDDFKWDRIMREGKEGTPLKDAVVRAEAAEAEVARLRDALTDIAMYDRHSVTPQTLMAQQALEAKP